MSQGIDATRPNRCGGGRYLKFTGKLRLTAAVQRIVSQDMPGPFSPIRNWAAYAGCRVDDYSLQLGTQIALITGRPARD